MNKKNALEKKNQEAYFAYQTADKHLGLAFDYLLGRWQTDDERLSAAMKEIHFLIHSRPMPDKRIKKTIDRLLQRFKKFPGLIDDMIDQMDSNRKKSLCRDIVNAYYSISRAFTRFRNKRKIKSLEKNPYEEVYKLFRKVVNSMARIGSGSDQRLIDAMIHIQKLRDVKPLPDEEVQDKIEMALLRFFEHPNPINEWVPQLIEEEKIRLCSEILDAFYAVHNAYDESAYVR